MFSIESRLAAVLKFNESDWCMLLDSTKIKRAYINQIGEFCNNCKATFSLLIAAIIANCRTLLHCSLVKKGGAYFTIAFTCFPMQFFCLAHASFVLTNTNMKGADRER